jgi:hypothetical protein
VQGAPYPPDREAGLAGFTPRDCCSPLPPAAFAAGEDLALDDGDATVINYNNIRIPCRARRVKTPAFQTGHEPVSAATARHRPTTGCGVADAAETEENGPR